MRSISLLIFIISACFCHAQIPEYYVYLVKGDVSVQKPNQKPEKIKQKHLIFNEDLLILPKNSEVTLVNKDAHYIVVNTPGTTKARDLGKKTHNSYTGVTKKYLNLVWHELLDPNYDYSKFKQQNLGGVWGGVSRGDACNNLIFPINGLKTSLDTVLFKWHKTTPSASYTLFVYNDTGAEILKLPVNDTLKTLDLNQAVKSKPGKYYWQVKSSEAGCDEEMVYSFELLSKEEEAALISSLISQTHGEDLLMQLDQLEQLEKNALILKASEYFASIIKDNPDNLPLLKSYIIFLFKYGFDAEAESAWASLVRPPR